METLEVRASDGVRLAAYRGGPGVPLYAVHGGPATDHLAFGDYLEPVTNAENLRRARARGV